MTCGMGDFNKDAVLAVVLDEDGEVIEYAKLGNPRDTEFKAAFVDIVNRRTPDVVGVAGFTVNSSRFFQILKDIVEKEDLTTGGDTDATDPLDVIWVQDEVARRTSILLDPWKSSRPGDFIPLLCWSCSLPAVAPAWVCGTWARRFQAIPVHKYQSLLPEETLPGVDWHCVCWLRESCWRWY